MLIAMAGLPGTGKSTIAARLAEKLGDVVLCKDVVRTEMFATIDYSREQDDATMEAIYARARRILCTTGHAVIIDGRTFSKAYQVRDLLNLVALVSRPVRESTGQRPVPPVRIIECICSDEVIRERLERDMKSGNHPAGNRNFDMYLDVKARAEPLTVPRLVLDTGNLSLEECVDLAMDSLARPEIIG